MERNKRKVISFITINKPRRSAYPRTPSGNPKLKLWLGLLIPKLFSYPPFFSGDFSDKADKYIKSMDKFTILRYNIIYKSAELQNVVPRLLTDREKYYILII